MGILVISSLSSKAAYGIDNEDVPTIASVAKIVEIIGMSHTFLSNIN